MATRALQIVLALSLIVGIAGMLPAVADAVTGAHADCCSDCDEPDCPEQEGQECPPQCSDCVCPTWVAPVVIDDGGQVALVKPSPQWAPSIAAELDPEAPLLRGVFRPPRAR